MHSVAGKDAMDGSAQVLGPQFPLLKTQGEDLKGSQVLAGLNSSDCSTWANFLTWRLQSISCGQCVASLLQHPKTRRALPCRGLSWMDKHSASPGVPGIPRRHSHCSGESSVHSSATCLHPNQPPPYPQHVITCLQAWPSPHSLYPHLHPKPLTIRAM